MTTYLVHRSDNPSSLAAAAGPFLLSRPVDHNVILTLLRERIESPEPGRYWWVSENGEVRGVAMQSPLTYNAVITPMPTEAIGPLVEAVVAEAPDLPGVIGPAAPAAAFAGCWTERRNTAAWPEEGERLYRLDVVTAPVGVEGGLRRASADDVPLLVEWWVAFRVAIGKPVESPDDGPESATHRLSEEVTTEIVGRVGRGTVWIWEVDGRPVSAAMYVAPVAAITRIAFVFTPLDQRGHGYAAASVAALCTLALSAEAPFGSIDACMLYTQLANATSNRVYRRIGFRSVAEVTSYGFGGG